MAAATLPAPVLNALESGGEVTLPPGEFIFTATPNKRHLTLNKNTWLRSQGRTILKLGPDNPSGPGWDHPSYPWSLFNVPPVSCNIKISDGIELHAPIIDPNRYPQSGQGPVDNTPPRAFVIDGSAQPNIKRSIDWDRCVIRGPFMDGIVLNGDNPSHLAIPPSGIWTELNLTNADIETAGQAIAAFGTDKRVSIRGLRARCGWKYPGVNGSGFGNVLYIHQGVQMHLTDFDLTTMFGRDAIKFAGVGAEGTASSSVIANGTVRSGRPGFGNGIGMDKFSNCPITNVYFESSLSAAVQVFGKASVHGSVIECPYAFTGTGDASGGEPVITLKGTRLEGVTTVFDAVMENAYFIADSCEIETDKRGTLFALPNNNAKARTQKMRIRNCLIRADNCEAVFAPRAGDWEVDSCDIRARKPRIGIFYLGAEDGASMRVRGGSIEGPLYYHSAKSADIERVEFR